MTVRRLLVAAGIGFALLTATPAVAQSDDEVPQPGLVTAAATCEHGTAAIKVWIEDEGDDTPKVRLDRLSPDTATLTKDTVLDKDMRLAVFEPVPAGEYNVHIDRGGDVRPDDVPVVVKPCEDLQPSDELLRVNVECQGGWGLATFVVANPRTKDVVKWDLTTGYGSGLKIELSEGLFLEVTENGVDDGTYTASLIADKKVVAKATYAVRCEKGNAPRLDVTAACADTITATVLNPNRAPVNYEVSVKNVIKELTLKGGERGSVAFSGLAQGEHKVLVKGDDKTQAAGSAKLDCGTPTTTVPPTTTTSETPAPQGRSDSGLANTGASVGWLSGVGALALVFGGALFMIGRRRVRRST